MEPAVKTFRSDSANHIAMFPVSDSVNRALKSSDMAVFMAPQRSQLEDVRMSTEGFATMHVVMINPRWLFEEEKSDFIGSFDVIYAITGLEVKGITEQEKRSYLQVCERRCCEWGAMDRSR
ncbi:hypothetical protein Bca52824_011441 [Brassica carinata]|uniref:DUF1995 domain-containing protein n=1 Tax=Brassica carinata TaxID=52824 RepID=A0A8X7WD89_BRACI|nr:hypothetical protein Bca52824_011441 [Brassica carinata]